MYIKRHIEETFLKRSKQKGAVVITGSRQIGKSTMIKNITDVNAITLDDLAIRASANNEPSAFLDFNPPPIFIDEVQYAPNLFPYIKIHIDETNKKSQYILSGSQSFTLMKNVTESLAGRAAILELMGISLRERQNIEFYDTFLPTKAYLLKRKPFVTDMPLQEIWKVIHRGSMPELVANPDYDWEDFYSDYVKTYIERDVRQLTQVADEMKFMRFMTVIAAMTGQLLNMSSLARDVDISVPTAERWLSILETSGIIYLLKPYHNNAIKRAIKTPKVYFLDTGLAAYLTKWLTPETLSNGAMKGAFFETFVIGEVLKTYVNKGKTPELFFLKTSNDNEIDLLIYENNTLYPIEIKSKTEPTAKDIRHFKILDDIKNIDRGQGGVICLRKDALPLTEIDTIIPITYI